MVSKAVHALTDGLTKLQAPIPLITATINLGAAVTSRIEIESMDKTTLPVLRPFMEDFLSKEGHLLFYRFGEWAQATRLAALSGEKGKVEAAVQFLRGANLAAYFLEELKAKKLPMGVMDSLKSIAEIEKKSLIGEEEVRRTLKAVTTIIEIMG
ncbi:MAG: hypothetical protein N3G78_01385 [Desulfobacterota bacterium]|nr:hypothetical protein [Thermodesulfobacteriota bacterium]